MTGELWEEWIRNWDTQMVRKQRSILLLIDNCSAHTIVPFLKNIRIEYFPANVTSILQPMDQGVIQNFKVLYRRLIIEKLISHIETTKGIPNISLIDAICDLSSAWQSVTPGTIKNCFRHGGLTSKEDDLEIEPDSENQLQESYIGLMTVLDADDDTQDAAAQYAFVDKDVRLIKIIIYKIHVNCFWFLG